MDNLALHALHQALGAEFTSVNSAQAVARYRDSMAEHGALRTAAGMIDLSFRSRLCLVGADRVRFLHGQVTNDIKRLAVGQGCYAALVTAKGRMESDLNIYCLAEELLLDFEPGVAAAVTQRLERYIVSDDVQVIDVAGLYGLLSVQGPAAETVVRKLVWFDTAPEQPFEVVKGNDPALGEIYLANHARLGACGFDLFVPVEALPAVADSLLAAVTSVGGRACGWQAFETARVEAGRPRFGVDMDEQNFPQEAGIEDRAVSYAKGCYIGQEVLNRIHTQGHVNRTLCGLRLASDLPTLPQKGDPLLQADKAIGWVTSSVFSPALDSNIALAFMRKEASEPGTELLLRSGSGESLARVVRLPFHASGPPI
jgi:folate-binding protein YgfZ